MNHARAIVWAQWRSLRNFWPHAGSAWSAVIGVFWYGLWVLFAIAAANVVSRPVSLQLVEATLPGGLLLMFLYWQLMPLLLAATGASLDLRKLLPYPIPLRQLFLIEVLLRVTAAGEMILVLAGVSIGMVLNPAYRLWGALGSAAFLLFNLLLAIGMRDLVARLLAYRRIREVAFLALITLGALPQVLFALRPERMRGSGSWFGVFSRLGINAIAWPWAAAGNLMQHRRVALAVPVLAGWCVLVGWFARRQFGRMLRFDAQAAGSAPADSRASSDWMEQLYRLPSRLFGDPLGALVEKDLRFLTRAPRFRMVFLMGFTFGVAIWLPLAFGRAGDVSAVLGDNFLTLISAYSLLLLGEVCFWNAFGFDRAAAQIYFVSPVPFSRALIAKNITASFFIALEIAGVALVCGLLGLPLGARPLAEAYAVAVVLSIFLMGAGNLISVYQARGIDPAKTLRSSASGRLQALMLLVYPVASIPVVLAYLARYAFGTEWAFAGVLLFDAVLGGVFYKVALDSAVAAAGHRKETMVAALAAGESPIMT